MDGANVATRSPGVEKRGYTAGRYIFREGEVGDHAFIVEIGTIEIVKSIGGQDVVLGRVTKGGMFGEMALIDDRPRMASARAVEEPTQVLVITQETFKNRLSAMDPFTRAMVGVLSDHVRSLANRLAEGDASLS